mmetsp:Transcript_15075/g.31062  ORF Transcript_15075/g.31062 Transcript_15075/m.31062 type:complete len:1056 (+) Transcript_15075:7-3174(+)
MSRSSTSTPPTPTYSVQSGSTRRSKISLSPACFSDHTFNASDVNRKVTETLLLKQLASHPAAKMNSLSPLLLPQAKSTQQATCSALASLCDATTDNVVKAGALYALCLYLSNRSKPQHEGTIRNITPLAVNAALTASPRYTREEVEMEFSRESLSGSGNSTFNRHKRRICGWVSEAPWGGELGIENTALTAKPGSLPLDNPLGSASSLQSEEEKEMSSLTEAIHRVEGSALAILKMLRDGKGDLTGIEEEATTSDKGDLEGDLVVVKTGCSTIVSSTVGNGDSIMSEIAAAGEASADGVVQRATSEIDDLSVQSELTMFDDVKPLSLTSIRRAGVAILACIVASIYNVPDAKSRAGAVKAFVGGGGLDALIVGSFYEWRDYYDPSQSSNASVRMSNMPSDKDGGGDGEDGNMEPGLVSPRSSISSNSNTSFTSSIISSTLAETKQINSKSLKTSELSIKSSKEEVNAFLLYQQNRRDQKTAEIVEKLKNRTVPLSRLFRIFNDKDSKHVKDNTRIMSEALTLVKAEDLKRLVISRTSALRRFLSSSHPTTWSYSPVSGYIDFFSTPPSGQPCENIIRPSGGLFWMVERPLSELYENKVRKRLEYDKKMEDAKTSQKVAKIKKKDTSLDLKKRLAAASQEAGSEIMRKNLSDERKMQKLRKRMDEANRKNKLKLMADLARSTEILVASLKSDGVDVEEYFKEQEVEERREAWMRKFGDLKPVSEPPSVRSHATTQDESNEDDSMRKESELERRARLRKEEREKREWYENTLEEREEKEIQRVHFIKTQYREKLKASERKKKMDEREERDWILKRRQDLIIEEHRGKKKEENEEKERKRIFNKYLVKLQNKVGRERKEMDATWKKREAAEEKIRQVWNEEIENKRKEREAEIERLRLVEEEKERERQEILLAAKAEAAKKLKMKQDKFKALKSLVLARLSGSTWVKKDGENKYYDAVNWREAVENVRSEVKDILGEEEEEEEDEKGGKDRVIGDEMDLNSEQDSSNKQDGRSMQEETQIPASPAEEPKRPTTEWIDIEVNGKVIQQNIRTQEFKEIS